MRSVIVVLGLIGIGCFMAGCGEAPVNAPEDSGFQKELSDAAKNPPPPADTHKMPEGVPGPPGKKMNGK